MEPGFVKMNWPAGPVQVITRIPKLRALAPAAPGPLSDGTWIVATSPALPISMPHTRSRYSVLAAALFTRRSPLPSPHAADDLHNWTICAPLLSRPHKQSQYLAIRHGRHAGSCRLPITLGGRRRRQYRTAADRSVRVISRERRSRSSPRRQDWRLWGRCGTCSNPGLPGLPGDHRSTQKGVRDGISGSVGSIPPGGGADHR
jgi:hypothetical protein